MHTVFSLSLFSHFLSLLLKCLGSCGFQRVRKGQPTVQSKEGHRINACYHLLSLLCVNTAGVTVITPRPLTPWCLYIVPSYSHTDTLKCMSYWANAQTHTHGGAGAHILTYRNMHTTTVGPLLSDNHYSIEKPRHPTGKSPPFPHTSHCRVLTLVRSQICGGCLAERKPCVLGRESITVPAESTNNQKSSKMKNLPFNWTSKDQTTQSGLTVILSVDASIEEKDAEVLFNPRFLTYLHTVIHPSGHWNAHFWKRGQCGTRLDTRPESESDRASSSNVCMTFLADWKGTSQHHKPPQSPL